MDLSPASPNVGYFLIYPRAWWEVDPHLGDSAAISRASAAAIVSEPTSIATADIYGFDWVPAPPDIPDTPVTWTNHTPSFFPNPWPESEPDYQTRHPAVSFRNYGDADTPNYRADSIHWFSAYALGGANSVFDPDGGVNALLVEITVAESTDLARIGIGSHLTSDFEVFCGASSDGGQGFTIRAGAIAMATDFDEVFTRIKVWRLPTRIWPVEPSEFWTNFVGSREIV